MIYTTEKTIKEHGDKVSDEEKKKIEAGIEKLRQVMPGDSLQAITQAREELMAASHKLAEEMYKQASQAAGEQAGQTGPQPGGPQPEQPASGEKKEGAVDADFEVVDDDKK